MTWRVWLAVGFVVVSAVSSVVGYYEISVPGAVETAASVIAFVLGPSILPLGAIAIAFAIDRRWVFLLPFAGAPVWPVMEWVGYYPRYGDSWDILTPSGLALYVAIFLTLSEFSLFLGLTLRIWWERRPPKWQTRPQ